MMFSYLLTPLAEYAIRPATILEPFQPGIVIMQFSVEIPYGIHLHNSHLSIDGVAIVSQALLVVKG